VSLVHSGGIRAVVVDDHLALRKGIEVLLDRSGISVCGVADSVAQAHVVLEAERPDIAILDVRLPDGSGAQLARELLARDPGRAVLLYTGTEDRSLLKDALDCGARGFALKAGPPEELLDAVRDVAGGGTYMDPRLSQSFLAHAADDGLGALTPREREVLNLLADGLTGAAIAQRLFLSPETVRTHVRNAMTKLEAKTRVHAVVLALRERERLLDHRDGASPAQ